jgi:N-acetylmuramoyl-L-alanine amidase
VQRNLSVRGTAPLGTLLLVLLATAFSARVLATEVIDVRLWRAPDHTRVVFDLSDKVEHRILELDNPARVVVDIDDARLQ